MLTLMGYEWKKIFMQKRVIAVFAVIFILICIGQVGDLIQPLSPIPDAVQTMRNNREHARALTGRELDGDFLYEIFRETEGQNFWLSPYRNIWHIIRFMGEVESPEEAVAFYTNRDNRFAMLPEDEFLMNRVSEGGARWIMQKNEQLPAPWVFAYTGGFDIFLNRANTVAIFLFFVIAICIASLFAAEHQTGVAPIMLAAKYGKSKLIWAKIFTAAGISLGLSLLFTLSTLAISLLAFGADGGWAMLQLRIPFAVYSLTLSQAAWILIINVCLRAFYLGALVALFSALTRSAFVSLILATVYMAPATLYLSLPFNEIRWVFNLNRLIIDFIPHPTEHAVSTFSFFPYEIFGLFIPPFIFEPIFSLVVGAGLLCCAGWVFKRAQVG
ncbi:MAG: ABC transporter permease [Defluviitaleaceae bacterium]|nr:ABC transporter permease [Defluviitaleaceae bacterium]MCL2276080.1 ABC transporter permease [Defluviitaleaceae bacterium]